MEYRLCGSNRVLIKSENGSNDLDWSDELDHVPFACRRKLLERRKLNSLQFADSESASYLDVIKKEDEQCDSQGLSSLTSVVSPVNKDIGRQTVQLQSCEAKVSIGVDSVVGHDNIQMDCCAVDQCLQNTTGCQELVRSQDCDSHEPKVNRNFSSDQRSVGGIMSGFSGADVQALILEINISSDFVDDLDHIVLKERREILLSRQKLGMEKPIPEAESLDNNKLPDLGMDAIGNFSFNMVPVKSELEFSGELNRDTVDGIKLQDQMKLLREDSELNTKGNFECLRNFLPSSDENNSAYKEASEPIKINRPRKRKKTATDSIETALDEDAPGLLQVLVEQGVLVDEIKLYGETDNDEAIDESFIEDGFADLEAVISKIFFQRNSLLKFAPIRCAKGSKPSYCLACLFSLVEQTRYLRFRNWPAEWGWCRDLLSFIFIFERHKRIVLERPEYGYATYFFELVDSVPIDWQVKRLVIAMKLTNCGRITLIENKTLLVGEDITAGEAEVLLQYGWTPNSGLGTMLNYRDRVVHDRKIEKDSSEWRSKIGKLLMDGYNGGSIVSSSVQAKIVESEADEKMEL